MKSIEENKISFYLLSFFLAFTSNFYEAEELYVLPGILLLIFFLKTNKFKKLLKMFFDH